MKQLFFALFFFGAGVFAAPPSWFVKNQANKDLFVGMGSGSDPRNAKLDALSDLASVISVEVDSSFSLNRQRAGDTFNENIRSNIQLKVEDIRLLDVDVLNTEVLDGIYYIQVGIKKTKVLDQIFNELNKELEKISLDHFKKCNFLDLKSFGDLQNFLKRVDSKIRIFNALSQKKIANQKLEGLIDIYSKNLPKPQANLAYENLDQNLQRSLSKEISKFVALAPKKLDSASNILIQNKKANETNIIDIIISDCNDVILFQEQIELNAQNINRAGFIVFKSLKEWIER